MIIRTVVLACSLLVLLASRAAPPAPDVTAAAALTEASGSRAHTTAELQDPAPQPPEPDELDLKALAVIEGVVQLFRQPQGEIWPGFSLAKQPFIVYRPGSWAILVGYLKDTSGFGPYPLDWPDLGHPVRFHRGQYEGLEGQLVFDFPLDDTTTVAVGLPEDVPSVPGLEGQPYEVCVFGYIVHECFHQYQYEAFGGIPWEREERYPILNAENTTLALLEMRALMGALRAIETEDSEECERQARTFVAVRTHRWKVSPPFVRSFEQGMELNEGTAKYVEVRSVGAMRNLKYHSDVPSDVPLPERFSLTAAGVTLMDFQGRLEEGTISPEDMPRNRVYPVGAAEGLLLDYFSVDWKEDAQLAGPDFEMASLLKERLGVSEQESEELLSEAMSSAGYDSLLAVTESRNQEYIAGFDRALADFNAMDGMPVRVSMKRSGVGRSRVSSAKKWLMSGGTLQLCSKYGLYSLSNDDLLFMIKDAALLEEDDWDGDVRTVTVKVTLEPEVEIDGEPVVLRPDRTYEFGTVHVTAGSLEIRASMPGTILQSDDGITVDLLQD
jgi:hypothetical protein